MSDFKHKFDPLAVEARLQLLREAVKTERDPFRMQEHMAEIQVMLSERAEIASQRMENHTIAILKLTRGLYWFTAVLIGIAVVQIGMMLCQYFLSRQ